MNTGRTVSAQLMDFVPSFSCLDQFFCMALARHAYRKSLRDIEACLLGAKSKIYHRCIRGKVYRNTLAHASETRDCGFSPTSARRLSRQPDSVTGFYTLKDYESDLSVTPRSSAMSSD